MAGAAPSSRLVSGATARPPSAPTEPPWVRRLLIAVALGFLGLFVVVPIAVVIDQALSQGLGVYRRAVTDPAARDAIALTLKVAAIAVPLNLVFGVAAAWAIAHFRFRGHYAGTKRKQLWSYNRHEGGAVHQEMEKVRYLAAHWA